MRVEGMTKDERFQEYDLPLIHAAIERARQTPMFSTITIQIDKDGGMLSCKATHEERIR